MPRRTKKPVSRKVRASRGKLRDAKVPKKFQPVFAKAQTFVDEYFSDVQRDTSKGMLNISGERYLLVRAASMSVDFFDTVKGLYKDMGEGKALDVARSLLFDIAHAIGRADARNFHKKMKVEEPVEKLSAGPIHFAHSGWAFVEILPESKPTPDENYYLIYDHPFSFESASWLKARKKSKYPVCVMNAGYSSGWCEESFGVTLVAQEIMCKAAGDQACRFIMAPPSKIEAHIKRYVKKKPALAKRVGTYEIPGFFKRKEIEKNLRASQAALQISEKHYRAVVDNVGIGVALISPKMEILTLNRQMRAWFPHIDVSKRPFCYASFNDPPRDEICNYCPTYKTLEDGKTHEEVTETPAGDEIRNYRIVSTPIFDAQGNVKAAIEMVEDITDRKKMEDELRTAHSNLERRVEERTLELHVVNGALRESEKRFQQVAESAEEWIWEVDKDGLYTYSNEVVKEILGYKPEEVVGKLRFYDFFIPDEKEDLKKAAFEVFERKERFKGFVNVNVHKEGKQVILETSGSPVVDRDGNLVGYRGLDMDITERIRAEEELKRALKMKSEFMAMMSHELRTPLTRIISSTHLVLRDPDAALPPKRVVSLNNVLASSDSLLIMINNVLEMARLEGGSIPVVVQECDLRRTIRTSISGCEGMIEEKEVHFAAHIDDAVATVHTDKEKLGHILINLLSNAVRYSDKGTVEIVARPSAKEGCVDIAVTDEGMGISHEKMPLLFQRFQQLEEVTKRRPGGIGLGLAIVKANLDFIGGTIDVKSKVGKGSTFTITIPVKLSAKSQEL